MVRLQKQQIENMLDLHEKAFDSVKKALDKGNDNIALTLLEQCQDSAIQIGDIIEKSLGEDFVTISLLENYCEHIYQMYEAIQQGLPFNVGKTCRNLRKELIRISNSVKNDIQVRITAVFLPYKASMWDSLESVWKAADEDPNCDVYVVPIPYFDKNPDGSFREIHYEGNEYPKYVPITSWEEYDIAVEHPDIIFIHNPYDEFNYVTSVAPVYYSKELKKYTDLLVYIPYFILSDIDPTDKEAVKNVEHFCTVPAVVYADKVIVQSKEWRQVYIDIMTQMMGNDTRQVWESKVLALGSPKLDKVYATGRNNVEIPEEWRKIIEKPDGSHKKIIFYNTSVSALLQHSEKMLKQMEYVFRVFKENQNEVALLWRPHPLIQATIESMRPQLWMEYEKIVNTYIEEGWGIYDNTADVNRAIAISDAYYGDPSSIVKMYEETGKFILKQVVKQDEPYEDWQMDENKFLLNFLAGAQVGEDIYFSAWNVNGLFKYNPQTGQCDFIKSFPGEVHWGLHSEAILYQNTIWFIPRASERIAIVELDNFNISFLKLPERGCKQNKQNIPPRRIRGCYEKGERYLWLIPCAYNLFIKIDMERQQIVDVQNWGNSEYAGAIGVRKQNELWVSIRHSQEFRIIDLLTGEQIIKPNRHSDIRYLGMQSINGNIWLFSQFMREGVFLLDSELEEKAALCLDDGEQWYYEYTAVTEDGDMLLVPYLGNQSVRIHVEKEQCVIQEMLDLQIEQENAYCSAKMMYDDQIWFLSHTIERPVFCYDMQRNTFSHRHILIDKREYEKKLEEEACRYGLEIVPSSPSGIFSESTMFLSQFMGLVRHENEDKTLTKDLKIGKKIYNALQWLGEKT